MLSLPKFLCATIFLMVAAQAISSYDTIVTLSGKLSAEDQSQCSFNMPVGNSGAMISVQCEEVAFSQAFSIIELHEEQKFDEHHFRIVSEDSKQEIGSLRSKAVKGVEWQINAQIKGENENHYRVNHGQLENEYTICVLYLVYTIVAGVSLPPGAIFYKNMEGMGIYNLIVSLHLSLALFMNLGVTASKYITQFTLSLKDIGSVLALLGALLCISMHLIYKSMTLLQVVSLERTRKTAMITFVLSMCVCVMGVPIFMVLHKNIFTFVYFASGLILYMCSFIVFKKMKKYFFSFRLVLADSCAILFLGSSSAVYPIMLYQIPSFYHLIGLILIVAVLLLNAGIAYILVNIIRREIRERKQKNKNFQINTTGNFLRQIQQQRSRSMRLEEKVESQVEISHSSYSSAASNTGIIASKYQP